ncbi:MAG: alpha/beta hydrolase [Rhodocyclaceae bacterium]|nr:alpha/beta hydrolase [Rhodocyclaceae bacterium]
MKIPGKGGLTIAAEVGGDPASPAVILLHGGGQTRHAWGKALHQLVAAGYHVLSLDLRGHGESDWAADGDYALESFVADLQAVAATLPGKPALVGASLGGSSALLAQGLNPDLAAALVLVDVAPRLEPQGVNNIIQFMKARPEGFASLEEVAQAIAAYNPHRPPPSDLEGLKKNLRRLPNGNWGWHWDPAFMADDRAEGKAAAMSQQMAAAARHVRIPTLLVRGMASDVVSPEGVAEFQALIPHLEVMEIQKTGHMVAGDKNDAFNTAILEFLGRHHPVHKPG